MLCTSGHRGQQCYSVTCSPEASEFESVLDESGMIVSVVHDLMLW